MTGTRWRLATSCAGAILLAVVVGLASASAQPGHVAALPKLSIGDVSQLEGSGGGWTAFEFTVSLSSATSVDVRAKYKVTKGTAQSHDVDLGTGQIRIRPGETSATVTVRVRADDVPEPDETFFVTLSKPENATIDDGQAVGTILDDDGGGGGGAPTISIDSPSVVEGNAGKHPMTFTVSLSGPAAKKVTVDWETAPGTAGSTDFDASHGTVTFKAGDTSETLQVPVVGDTLPEANETFFVVLSNAKNATIATAQGTGTILDDDLPRLSITDTSVLEGNSGTSSANFTVSLSSPAPAGGVSFTLATADGTASAPSDYTSSTVGATIPAGNTQYSFSVPIVGDTVAEPDETFFVNVTNVVGANVADGQGLGTIVNDDGAPPTPTLSIGSVSQAEGNIGSTPFVFTVSLAPASSKQVKVDFSTANGTALSGFDYGPISDQVTFAPGETSKLVTVFVTGDTTPEPNETFFVNLSNPINALIGQGQGTGTIVNDDDQPPTSNDQSQTTLEDTPILLTLSASDPEGESLSFHIVSGPGHGSLGALGAPSCAGVPSNCTATVTYTPAANYVGADSFTFKTNDGFSDSPPATVSLTVTPVNDPPSFTKGADQTVVENSGGHSIGGWATGISPGPPDENSQTVSFHASNDNNGLFSSQPSVAPNGTLSFTPATDQTGSATVSVYATDDGGTANGGIDTSATQTFTITVTLLNHAPSFSLPGSPNQTVLEDGGAQTVSGFATSISPGPPNESGQTVTMHASNDNNALFSSQPSINSSTGDLTYTPAPNANGSATVSVFATDDGGTAGGGSDTSATQTFQISVTPVNDPPDFTKGADQTVIENSGVHTVSGWATGISKGPADESSQTVTFHVSNDNNALFSSQPSVASDGTLTFTPATDQIGSATVSVFATDDGGTANGGIDTSATKKFTIAVTLLNHAPSFDLPGSPNQTVLEDAGAQTVSGFATNISKGPANESGQTLTFHVSNDNNSLFSSQPSIDPSSGDLTYTPAANANGSTTVSVFLTDNGGTADGGSDTSTTKTFTIGVTAVNDPPSFTKGADENVIENSGAHSVPGWATGISAGPADESGQAVHFNITGNTNSGLFSSGPAVSSNGTLTYTLAADVDGTATITLTAQDDGGGTDTSAPQSFTITVALRNHAPSFSLPGSPNQTVLEDAGAQTVSGFATAISPGPANEAGQTVTMHASNDNNGLFSVQPSVNSSTGDLTYTPAANANGSATVTVWATDNGGTANGGSDQSANQTFTINVTPVNDAPSFTLQALPNQTVLAGAGAQSITGFATAISPGAANESGQALDFIVTNDNNGIFTAQPAISPDGTLSFTPVASGGGSATVSVKLHDDGGTANGGQDTSGTQTFTITVNDPPQVTSDPSDVSVYAPNVATFTAAATGTPSPTVQWQVSTDGGGSYSNVAGATSTTLSFATADGQNGNKYRAVFTNTAGNATSAAATLTVNLVPSVTTNPTNLQVADGATATFTAAAAGRPTPTVQWQLSTDGGGSFNDIAGATSTTLSFTAHSADSGHKYRAVFTNGGGSATTTAATLLVNQPPTAASQSTSTNEDTLKTITLSGTDADGDPLTFSIVSGPTNGSLGSIGTPNCSGNPSTCTATVDYTPSANFNGSDSFTFKTNDGHIDSTTNGTVSITVNAVDDPPVAVNDSATVLEDASATAVDVLANDTDIDGGPKSIQSVTQPANGTVVITGGGTGLTYQPNANYFNDGSPLDTFTYTLNGGSVGTVSMTVTGVNDAPSFTKGADQTNVQNQNANGTAKAYTIAGWATAISAGPGEGGQTVDFVIDSVNPSNLFTVQPAVAANGDLTFTTDPAHSGTATVTLHIHDNGGTANGGVDHSATQSFSIQTVNPPPTAVNDAYTATGNVSINVNDVTEGVLQRGTDDTLFGATITNCGPTNTTGTAVSSGSCTTTSSNGGDVVLSTDGTFTYDPPAGFTGADHFFYKLTNSGGSSVGDVTVTVSSIVWFVDDSAGSAGDGRLDHPFNSLAAFQAVNNGAGTHPAANQPIFLYTGSSAYTGGVTLLNGQKLFGQAASASLATLTGITLPSFSASFPSTGGTAPSLTTSGGSVNAITLGAGNTVQGLDVGDRSGSGISGSGFGTLTLSEVNITGAGQALSLATGTVNAAFGTVSSSSGTNGISLTSIAGSPTFTGGTLTGSSGDEFVVNGGSSSFTYPGAITNTGTNKAVNISNRTGGTLTLSGAVTDTGGTGDGISLTSNTGATVTLSGGISLSTAGTDAFTATGGGTINVNAGATRAITTTTGTALTLNGVGGTITLTDLDKNGAGTGISLTSVSAAVTVPSGATIQNTTTAGVAIDQGIGAFSYAGTISNSSGRTVQVTNRNTGSPGLVQFTGSITSTGGTGVDLDNNDNGTVTFSGGLVLSTGANTAYNAINGGTVNVTGSGNTLTTTTGTALNVANTTIGASGLTFQSISANGAGSGIILNNTGGTAGLTVTGNSGTCTSTGSTCTGGTIQATTGHGISLTSTKSPSFSFMKITNIALSGIWGTQVTNFTLDHSVIDGVNTSHDTTDADVAFNLSGGGSTENNVSGAVSITNNTLNNSWQNGIAINNYAGTISSLTIDNNSLTSVAAFQPGSAGTAIQVLEQQGSSAGQITAGTISGNTIHNFPGGGGIAVHGGSTANLPASNIGSLGSPIVIEDNTITGAGTGLAGIGTNGVELTIGQNSSGYFTVGASGHPNTITNVAGNGIACSLFGTGTEKCSIVGNTIDANNTAGSPGINTGADSATSNTNTPTLYLDIHNNTVQHTQGAGILSTIRSTDGNGIFKIENNSVTNLTSTGLQYGIRVDSGNGTESAGATVCLKIDGNTAVGHDNASHTITNPGIGIRQNHATVTSTFNIDGLSPNPANDSQMETYVSAQNPASASGTFGTGGTASISGGATYHAATCTIP